MKPVLLAITLLTDEHRAQIAQSFELIYALEPAQIADAIARDGARVQAVLTIGSIGLSATQMDALPQLRLVCALGAGYENIDIAHARARDIAVANAPEHYILRSSWVIGEGHNFVKTMMMLSNKVADPADKLDQVTVVDDQVGRLTFTETMAGAIFHLLG